MSLHNRIKEARKNKGITQTELGDKIGVAKTTVAGYEKNREPTAAQLGAIADILDVDVEFLLQDEIRIRHETRATPQEMETLVKKYRTLDPYGKEAVDGVLDVEYRRCRQNQTGRDAALFRNSRQEMEVAAEIEPDGRKAIDLMFDEEKTAAGSGYQLIEERMQVWKVLYNELTRKADFCIEVDGQSMEPMIEDGDIILIRQQPSVDIGEIGLFTVNDKGYVKKQGTDRLISINKKFEDIIPGEFDTVFCRGKVIGVLDPEWIIEQ